MTLYVLISGRARYVAPFRAEDLDTTAATLREQLPAMRQEGRVAIFVTDGNVAHLIATREAA
jgi:hypothetical protein